MDVYRICREWYEKNYHMRSRSLVYIYRALSCIADATGIFWSIHPRITSRSMPTTPSNLYHGAKTLGIRQISPSREVLLAHYCPGSRRTLMVSKWNCHFYSRWGSCYTRSSHTEVFHEKCGLYPFIHVAFSPESVNFIYSKTKMERVPFSAHTECIWNFRQGIKLVRPSVVMAVGQMQRCEWVWVTEDIKVGLRW